MNIDKFHKLDVILVCGLQGSGKSHFSKEYFKNTNRKRINRAEIRRMLYEMTHFGDEWTDDKFNEDTEYLVKHVESKIYEDLLHKNEKILVDNTSITKASRRIYIDLARQKGKSVGIIFLNTPISKCLERNKQREHAVKSTVVSNLFAQIELPKDARSEGVNETLIINDY